MDASIAASLFLPDEEAETATREGATLCSHDAALRAAASSIGLALLPV